MVPFPALFRIAARDRLRGRRWLKDIPGGDILECAETYMALATKGSTTPEKVGIISTNKTMPTTTSAKRMIQDTAGGG